MATQEFTYDLILAAAQDAGDRHAKEAGRPAFPWDKTDYIAACDEFKRLAKDAGIESWRLPCKP